MSTDWNIFGFQPPSDEEVKRDEEERAAKAAAAIRAEHIRLNMQFLNTANKQSDEELEQRKAEMEQYLDSPVEEILHFLEAQRRVLWIRDMSDLVGREKIFFLRRYHEISNILFFRSCK